MDIETKITETLRTLQSRVPTGFAMALHVRFATPTFLFQTYPKDWADFYSEKGLVMTDPTVAWGFVNTGSCRWSELDLPDPANVMAEAANYGLKHGVVIAVDIDNSRSFASFSDATREFTDAEISDFKEEISSLHTATAELNTLSPDVSRNLRKMSVTISSAGS